MKKKVLASAILAGVMAFSATSFQIFAQEGDDVVIYENEDLMTTDEEVLANATENQNSVTVLESEYIYYEDGKFYEFNPNTPKTITQKVNAVQRSNDDIVEEYVTDVVVSGSLTTYAVDEEIAENFVDDTYYPKAGMESITRNKVTEDASVMGIRYTVYFKTIQVDGGTAIAISHSYGKVVHCDTGSGVYPQTMEFYANIDYTATYNEYGGYLGMRRPNIQPKTIYNPSIGEDAAYIYNINNFDEFFYIGGDAFMAGTSLTVNASRGVTLYIGIDLSGE